jgi:O-antigen ligase
MVAVSISGRVAVLIGLSIVAIIFGSRTRSDAGMLLGLLTALIFLVPAALVFGPLGAAGSPATLVGMSMMFLWVLGRISSSLRTDRRKQPLRTAVLIFLLSGGLSYAAANTRPMDALEAGAADRGVITLLAVAGICLIACDGIGERAQLELISRAIVLGGAIVAVIGIIQFAAGIDLAGSIRIPGLTPNSTTIFIDTRSGFRRVSGTSTHAIEYSVVLSMTIPIAAYLALTATRLRWLWWTCAATMGLALPMSISRTAVVTIAAVGAVLLIFWRGRRRRYALVAAAGCVAALHVVVPGLLGTIKALFVWAGYDPSISAREQDYELVKTFVMERPVLGRGFFTFLPETYDYLDNQYYLSAVETGLVGVAVLLALFVVGGLLCMRVIRSAAPRRDRELAIALLASISAATLASGTFDFLSFPQGRNLFFLVLGCAGALWRLAVRDAPRTVSPTLARSAPGLSRA